MAGQWDFSVLATRRLSLVSVFLLSAAVRSSSLKLGLTECTLEVSK